MEGPASFGRRLALVAVVLAGAIAAPVPAAALAAERCLDADERAAPKSLKGWNVCLKASRRFASVGRRVTFTAETNGPMRDGDRSILIVDATAREPIEICRRARVCTVKHRERDAGPRSYVATVTGLKGRPPRSRRIRVTWLDFELELSAYATGRGPASEHPALLCSTADEECATNTVDESQEVTFYVKATRRIPSGLILRLEDPDDLERERSGRAAPDLAACSRGPGCRAPSVRQSATDPPRQFRASLYVKPRDDEDAALGRNRVFSSDTITMGWADWTPRLSLVPGERVCDPGASNCRYRNATLRAEMVQPLQPGVVVLLYVTKGCVPKPGDPAGDPGCVASSPKNCSPPSRECTYTGDLPAGYEPGAVVVFNSPRPMLVYGSAFLPGMP